jgi:DNA-binding NarL/FixJ family response regulator
MGPSGSDAHRAGIRVVVIDDHPIIRDALSSLLSTEDGIVLAAVTATVDEAIMSAGRIDVALLDLRLGTTTTVTENVESLHTVGAEVIAFTSGESIPSVREAARAGAVGIVPKSSPPEFIVRSIRAAADGQLETTISWASAIDSDSRLADAGLTAREREVLARYASGERAESVARELFISRETVLEHIKKVRLKYAAAARPAPTKIHLYQRALEDGYLEIP